MGIPASGKSTLAHRLAAGIGGTAYLEPEEESWPQVVLEADSYGQFECLMWFRNTRVPMYIDAARAARDGQLAVVDSVWDKLYVRYMSAPCMRWVLASDSPYYEAATAVATADMVNLPDPDAMVFITVRESVWHQLLRRRGRMFDSKSGLSQHYGMQAEMLEAVSAYCQRADIPLLSFPQELLAPEHAVIHVVDGLRALGVRL